MSDDDFDTVINVHLRGTFTCAREAATLHARAGRGRPHHLLGSPTGQRGNFGQTNYAAAKAGIVGMVRTWALELARAGITVNAVIPVAATAMTATVPSFAAAVEADAQRRADARRSSARTSASAPPEDVAGLIAYLASDAAAEVTGQAIGIGGDRSSCGRTRAEVTAPTATAAGRRRARRGVRHRGRPSLQTVGDSRRSRRPPAPSA